ncbi:acyltransferase [Fulvivirga sediminis]|uniref:Acyltransferase n=1 Tax=Fulvivirga sediminis TaxID=2803949 RepID=A0A937F9C8_9BACT|nr:acyltransferase [Fulvivirga sediminis]MBL3658716.1 acyltransferase [Fulvivirga sediminis]
MGLSLSEYVKRRNGVAMGSSKSLRNNLYRSLGASNFSLFWNYWNPIFGYYLGNFIFKPLKKFAPVSLALILTFVFCGLIHDAVTTLLRQHISLFFTLWFFFMSLIVLLTRSLQHNFSKQTWLTRAAINIAFISICFLATYLILKVDY